MKPNNPNGSNIDTPHENCSTVSRSSNPFNTRTNCLTELNNFRLKYCKNFIMCHVNTNSLSN